MGREGTITIRLTENEIKKLDEYKQMQDKEFGCRLTHKQMLMYHPYFLKKLVEDKKKED